MKLYFGETRGAGVVAHVTSLPPEECGGVLGTSARCFIDWVHDTGLRVWQMLPIAPTSDDSPFQAISAHAGDPAFVSIAWLRDNNFVPPQAAGDHRPDALTLHAGFVAHGNQRLLQAFRLFKARNRHWLRDFGLFTLLSRQFAKPWWEWPTQFRDRNTEALVAFESENAAILESEYFLQFAFESQWNALRSYADDRGVLLFGDFPLYMAHNSCDVWANRHLFFLDGQGWPPVVGGVPPDYYSDDGQKWGNPVYNWEAMAQENYAWWIARFDTNIRRFDLIKVDHFRGYDQFWEIHQEASPKVGVWRDAGGRALFAALQKVFGDLPLVSEDLGIITPSVETLRDELGLPGMRILQFGFGDAQLRKIHHPENYPAHCVAYSGTHDNDTLMGWWSKLDISDRNEVRSFLAEQQEASMPWPMLEALASTPAGLVMYQLQDLLGFGSEARMNRPGLVEGNWSWKFSGEDLATLAPSVVKGMLQRTRRTEAGVHRGSSEEVGQRIAGKAPGAKNTIHIR